MSDPFTWCSWAYYNTCKLCWWADYLQLAASQLDLWRSSVGGQDPLKGLKQHCREDGNPAAKYCLTRFELVKAFDDQSEVVYRFIFQSHRITWERKSRLWLSWTVSVGNYKYPRPVHLDKPCPSPEVSVLSLFGLVTLNWFCIECGETGSFRACYKQCIQMLEAFTLGSD